MAAATRVIAAQGLGAATATIAKEAGVSNGSLFTYFATKADLLSQLYVELKSEMGAVALQGLPTEGDVRGQMLHLWRNWLRWAASRPEKRRALAHLGVSDDIAPESREAAHRAMAGVAALLQRSRENGPLRNAPLAFVSALMSAMADTTMDFMIADPANADGIARPPSRRCGGCSPDFLLNKELTIQLIPEEILMPATDLQSPPASRAYAITGPTSGIGRATALELAKHGTVVLVGRDAKRLEDIQKVIENKGGRATSVVCDLSDISSVRRAAAEIVALRLSIAGLLNNAGDMQKHPTKNAQGWDLTFATNHLGPFALTEALAPHLPDGANVVFVVSAVEDPGRKPAAAAGFRGGRYISAEASARGEWKPGGAKNPGFDAYATSKQAMLAATLALARECSRLRFNAVEPGVNVNSESRSATPTPSFAFWRDISFRCSCRCSCPS